MALLFVAIAIAMLGAGSVGAAPVHAQVGLHSGVSVDDLVTETAQSGEESAATDGAQMASRDDPKGSDAMDARSEVNEMKQKAMDARSRFLKNEMKQKVLLIATNLKMKKYVPWCGSVNCWKKEEVHFKSQTLEAKRKLDKYKELKEKADSRR
jgi:hypothetical protein